MSIAEDERLAQEEAERKAAKVEQAMHRKGEIAAALQRLSRHPDWELLTTIFEKKKATDVDLMSRMILAGNVPPKEALDYERGFWDGVGAVLKRPENAEARFQAALSRLARDAEAENAEL